jgi:hypothetical protein
VKDEVLQCNQSVGKKVQTTEPIPYDPKDEKEEDDFKEFIIEDVSDDEDYEVEL